LSPSANSTTRSLNEVQSFASANKPSYLSVGTFLIIGTLIFNTILESRTLKLEENNQTEYNSKIQEQEIEDQKNFIADGSRKKLAIIVLF
jgi:hypothetical protein